MRLRVLQPRNLTPAGGVSHAFHVGLQILLPLGMLIMVKASFIEVAFVLVLLSKWRMFAVRPRFWAANIRANAVDIMIGLSVLAFMVQAESFGWQFFWAAAYAAWLLFVKPLNSARGIAVQAAIGQLAGLMALFLVWADGRLYGLVLLAGLICYISARHFFDSFDEPYARLLSYMWAYFAAALVWVLGHWLLFYGLVAQPTLLLTVLGYGIAMLYYFDHHERLGMVMRRQIVAVMVVVVGVVLLFSRWYVQQG